MKIIQALAIALVAIVSAAAPASAQEPDGQQAVTTSSGLTYVITHAAGGRKPRTGEFVLVHYTGTLTDGTKFDSSHDRNDPLAFQLGMGRVIKGWDEGIAKLGIGDRAVLIVPPSIGYGAKQVGTIPPNSTLIFVVELVDAKDAVLSQTLMKTIKERGINAALAQYRDLRVRGFDGIYTSESDLNGLGYQLMGQNKLKEAIEIFKLNVSAHPKSANVYDSLGEAYMKHGDTKRAIENYEKSLELDPKNTNAAEMLRKLRGE